MGKDLFFGINPLDYIFRVNNPLKQRELALHLFCNLNLSTESAQQIFLESAYLLPNEYQKLIKKVKLDYSLQPTYPQILDDDEYFKRLCAKLKDWICWNGLPNLDELARAIEIFKFPSETIDLLVSDSLEFNLNQDLDGYIAWVVDRKHKAISEVQLKRIKKLHIIFRIKFMIDKIDEQLRSEDQCKNPSQRNNINKSQRTCSKSIDLFKLILDRIENTEEEPHKSPNDFSDLLTKADLKSIFIARLNDLALEFSPPKYIELEKILSQFDIDPNDIVNSCVGELINDNKNRGFRAIQVKRFLNAYATYIDEQNINMLLEKYFC